jgi:hypothetical protein
MLLAELGKDKRSDIEISVTSEVQNISSISRSIIYNLLYIAGRHGL